MLQKNQALNLFLDYEKKWVICDQTITWFSKILLYVLFIRYLSPLQYGEFYKYFSLAVLFSWIFSPLFVQSSIRLYPLYKSEEYKLFIKNLLHTYFLFLILLVIICCYFYLTINNIDNIKLPIIISTLFISQIYVSTIRDLVNIERHRKKYAISRFISEIIKLILLSFFVINKFNIIYLFFSLIISDIFQILFLKNYLNYSSKLNINPKRRRILLKKILILGFPLSLLGLVSWFSQYSDRYIIEYFLDLQSSGKYLAAITFIAVPFNALMMLISIYYTPILYGINNYKDLNKKILLFIKNIFIILLIFSSCISIFLLIFQKFAYIFFGHEYSISSNSYLPIIFGSAFFTLSSAFMIVLLTLKKTRDMFYVGLMSSFFSLSCFTFVLYFFNYNYIFYAFMFSKLFSFLFALNMIMNRLK